MQEAASKRAEIDRTHCGLCAQVINCDCDNVSVRNKWNTLRCAQIKY